MLIPIYTQGGGVGSEGRADCFATISETANLCRSVGFNILVADHAPDAWTCWQEITEHDPRCKAGPQSEAKIIQQDGAAGCRMGMSSRRSLIRMPCGRAKTPLLDRLFGLLNTYNER